MTDPIPTIISTVNEVNGENIPTHIIHIPNNAVAYLAIAFQTLTFLSTSQNDTTFTDLGNPDNWKEFAKQAWYW